ncbi:Kazal-type serine protease inhibitor domain-containing protein [Chelativorans sp. AA-79]|uniref:Kazal-type serine protease inhibitor domain-containing protein n=1 Tax=Chelativorans sp. AA-79 TaxID=3028735 RepID=UPI0023F6FD93|nr:Kazal-type serine protease inhibitor domain-containing protein [Chelativorans sp. AA-79]WEX09391.1 Kazal-type serine protease inhibitor domain-containing protein [Chelativorans sp. AA-79]
MKFLKNLAGLGALAFAGLILWSCTVVVDEEPRPRPPEGPRICTQHYQPVCAARGDRRRTFSNACIAQSEGFRPIHPGECRDTRPPQACTREYRPVCAVRSGRERTFPNACMAEADGYRPIHPGECRQSGGRPPQSDRPQFCTQQYEPVCAVRGNRMRTFGNACEAQSSDYRIIRRGEC